ncbi:hypothetical protein BB559_003070 [Furculomyces boomerangus]|uniref:Uncharacterized protein n=1 Tax=Furculomyces boomerangus TaxID=61424 RepID=A0A2T9YP88_9FUNG|nr:hypothetical protein BB559_003070 [Furculomyces boomerangus]
MDNEQPTTKVPKTTTIGMTETIAPEKENMEVENPTQKAVVRKSKVYDIRMTQNELLQSSPSI